ncbi:MAG: signal peptidase II [Chloroflexota bacterium]
MQPAPSVPVPSAHQHTGWRFGVVLLVGAGVLLIDQVSKALVRRGLASGNSIDLFGGLVRLDFTRNQGAAFGILRQEGGIFILVALLVTGGILAYHRRISRAPLLARLGLGLVLGGALGNVLDRLRLGYVVDFVDLRWWPVFNLADSAIVIGVCALALYSVLDSSANSS